MRSRSKDSECAGTPAGLGREEMSTIEGMEGNRSTGIGGEVLSREGVNDGRIVSLNKPEVDRKQGEALHKVPADESDTDEGAGLPGSVLRSRRCKARRARRKAYRPYYQLSEGERNVR